MVRSKSKIILDILKAIKDEKDCKKTTIVRKANLDWDMATRYLGSLIEGDYVITSESNKKGNKKFELTEEGRLLFTTLRKLRKICSIL